jgi:membrane protein implicated in regulation of membrane protease activity
MIDYIDLHQAGFWIALGFIMLTAEVLLFGFTTIIFFFAGIGALITGLAMNMNMLAETWIAGVSCFGVSTGLLSIILWEPLKKLQDSIPSKARPTSDLVGYEFVLQQKITTLKHGIHRYSGVDWKVELDAEAGDSLDAGQRVVVTSLDAGIFRIKACSNNRRRE